MKKREPRMTSDEADQLLGEVGGESYAQVAEMDRAYADLLRRLTDPVEGYRARLAQALDHARLFEGAVCADLYRDRRGRFRTILIVRKEAQPILTALQARLEKTLWSDPEVALWSYPHQREVSATPMGDSEDIQIMFMTATKPLRGRPWSMAAVIDWLHERGVVAPDSKAEVGEIEREIEAHKKRAAALIKRKRDLEQATSKKGSLGSRVALRALIRSGR